MIANRFLRLAARSQRPSTATSVSRCFSFSFAGPKTLEDVMKKALVGDKSRSEVADIWYTYHEEKDNVHGLVLKGKDSESLLARAGSR